MRQKNISFGPSPVQDYKVYSACRNNKPSAESLESDQCSAVFYLPQYYC